MNVKQAKESMKESIRIYLKKDEFGDYEIPVVRQRPVFLLGAPGVGKTAIMEQIAQEMGIALVSYSMTHHTRQSALGLPFIKHKSYDGFEVDVSEYTMSEIIASVYDTMEESGIREGILFLDEINCVSETLAPSMLQFLQYKVFGRHKVPEGWVIVTAGNPPEYNKSVREFDVVVMDRLKVMEVEPDFAIWKEYAVEREVHTAILQFLDMKRDYFYQITNTVKGRNYVTARGWEDLSQILKAYEEDGLKVTNDLIGQYIHDETVVREFGAYYELYQKYKRDYRVQDIFGGEYKKEAIERAKKAALDERLSLLSMLMEAILHDMKECVLHTDYLKELSAAIKGYESVKDAKELAEAMRKQAMLRGEQLQKKHRAMAVTEDEKRCQKYIIRFLSEQSIEILQNEGDAFSYLKERFGALMNRMQEETKQVLSKLHHLFAFVEAAFADGNELLILVTQLTVNQYSAKFLARFGSEDYQRHQKELMISERESDMKQDIEDALNHR